MVGFLAGIFGAVVEKLFGAIRGWLDDRERDRANRDLGAQQARADGLAGENKQREEAGHAARNVARDPDAAGIVRDLSTRPRPGGAGTGGSE